MKIQVTKLDIDRGLRNSTEFCAVARAVRRTSGYKKEVHSGIGWITVGQLVYMTPFVVRDFIKAFDFGKPVEPFEFELENIYGDSSTSFTHEVSFTL